MFAKAKALDARKQEMERLRAEKLRQNSMSPHEKRIQDRLRQQVHVILVYNRKIFLLGVLVYNVHTYILTQI